MEAPVTRPRTPIPPHIRRAINGRNELAWGKRIDLDVEYVENQGPLFDARIVAGTGRALLSGAGVAGHDANDPFVIEPELARG